MSKAQRKARAALNVRASMNAGEVQPLKQDKQRMRNTWNKRQMSPAWAWKKENGHAT